MPSLLAGLRSRPGVGVRIPEYSRTVYSVQEKQVGLMRWLESIYITVHEYKYGYQIATAPLMEKGLSGDDVTAPTASTAPQERLAAPQGSVDEYSGRVHHMRTSLAMYGVLCQTTSTRTVWSECFMTYINLCVLSSRRARRGHSQSAKSRRGSQFLVAQTPILLGPLNYI